VFWKRDVVLAQEYLAFLLLNLCDLFLTGYILRNNGLEANGVAAWILTKFHGQGFVVYKFGLMVVLVACCEGISLKNIRLSRFIVTFACLMYVLLVIYECCLIFGHITGPASGQSPLSS